ncbi:MAG TPA: GtrA family protein [Anaerolineales bacterium]|nr:GtrA family protein [Anaerolineales bacterium]HRQ92887.1 GtrA family protein [Anaerolineales bacterium]
MTVRSKRRELKRFARFSTVGAIGAVVDFAVFNLLLNLAGVIPALSQAISFLVAVSSNFILNRKWTYKDSRSKPWSRQMAQYGLVNLVGLLIRTPIFNGLAAWFDRLAGPRPTLLGLSTYSVTHNLALAGAIGIVLFWNFFINRFWTYGDVELGK